MRAWLSLILCCALSVSAWADSYPSRPIRLIIPFPPAGITDLAGRLVADGLRARLGQPVIVENKAGANGIVGLRELMKSDPDGYTLMMGNVGSLVINYAMDASAPFDPMRDVVPIAGTSEYGTAMIVNNKTPVHSVKEFIEYAKARPGRLSFGSTGIGALDYLAPALFMRQTGTQMVHVPYRGGPLALNDLLSGQIDLLIEVFPVVMEQIRSGAVRGLAVSNAKRVPSVPNLPTFEEAGVRDLVLTGWLGLYGPAKLPNDIRDKLGAATVEVVKSAETQQRFRDIGFEPTGQGVTEFTAHHAAEVKRWLAFIGELGLRK
jgi:tripartite-type tricarboxylate transporter receptor subunit TctC